MIDSSFIGTFECDFDLYFCEATYQAPNRDDFI